MHINQEPVLRTDQVYRVLPESEWPKLRESTFLHKATKILMTDDNMKPMHIDKHAENTEFHVIRNSDTLLIVVGESWTYGEALPGVGSGAGMYNFHSQLQGCLGPRIAEVMGWDLYQFAIPGNCNLYIHLELDRILSYVSTLGYKQIKVVLQLTENARECVLIHTKLAQSHKINDWLNAGMESEIDVYDWLSMYDEIFYESFDKMIRKFTACPIEGILWRNFTKTASNKTNYSFKIIDPYFIGFTSRLVNHELEAPLILNVTQFDDWKKHRNKKVLMNETFLEEQLNLVEKLFDFIGGKSVPGLVYHNNHPTAYGHMVFAHHIIRQAGWKDI
jgi:hypothetical protein